LFNKKGEKIMVDLFNLNGQTSGQIASQLVNNGGTLKIGSMRPYLKTAIVDNREVVVGTFVNVYVGGDPKKITSYREYPINNNATLRRDEWKQLDDAILMASRQRLGGVEDLITSNLTFNLGNAMGTTMLEWHDVDDNGEAEITMDGITRAKNSQPNFQHNFLPIPIIHYDYEINARLLEASRNLGNPLDTIGAERAARRVMEKLENMLFTNTTYSFGEKDSRNQNAIYSYVNHPDRNIVALGTNWDELDYDSATSSGGEIIVNKVIDMKQTSINARHYGPWKLYIPTNYETILDKDYDKTTPGTTIRERILKIDGISGIKVVDTLAADNVLLVQMTSDVVRLVRGMGLQNVQWNVEGGMKTNFKVMTIQVVQIRSDQNGYSGIVHAA
jgi:hypothetical protein